VALWGYQVNDAEGGVVGWIEMGGGKKMKKFY
jgi:hypothetical protein